MESSNSQDKKGQVKVMDEKSLIKFLFQRGTLSFGKFTLKSGRISPYFFNLGVAMSDGEGLLTIARSYSEFIKDKIGFNSFTFLLGPAYKGIPLVAQVAASFYDQDDANLRWGFNRKEAKTHGEASAQENKYKILDGDLRNGDKILIIDDVLTQGNAKLEVIDAIATEADRRELQVNFCGILVMIDRKEGAKDLREKIPVWSILDIEKIFTTYKDVELDGKIPISKENFQDFLIYKEKYM